jgi:hypothetical protein
MALIPEALASAGGTGNAPRLPVNGDTIANPSPTTNLVFKNGTGGVVTITVLGKKTCSQGGLHDLVASVAIGAEEIIGPIDSRYADPITGLATVSTYSATTGSTVYTTRV